ncbi:MAG: SDR family oxidoreductase [Lutibacter sp.]|uniref:SDR family oxidoreductase n=1 Tax=Lutibacter sp. TaxID=1925666 RepID=UPI00299E1174|nr:SDR family oxidoreductase [Lutibacter sp.]MDX1828113.1 SDR family oxidoreductase [Lutibacter sp.]
MKINLKNKKALVGGSTQGLGKAIALQLAKCGAEVTLMARNKEKLEKVKSELNINNYQNHKILVVDFTDFDSYKNIITNYFKLNTVDILINNTNGPKGGNVFEKNIDEYQQAFDLLFKSVVFTTMLAIDNMKKKNFGRIINATSLTVKEPLEHLVLSNSIRAAVTTWAKTLSNSVAANGITVNNILTGLFDTERIKELNALQAKSKGITSDSILKSLTDSVPMKRLGKPEEFGYLVSFLASEYASYITGTNLPIDGGLIKSL